MSKNLRCDFVIIDGHGHAYGEYSNVDSIKQLTNDYNVDKIVLCAGRGQSDEEPKRPRLKESFISTRPKLHLFSNRFLRMISKKVGDRDLGNHFVYSLKQQLPQKIIQFYWVNFNDNNYYEKLILNYKEMKFEGIKLHQCVVPFSNKSEEMSRVSQFAASNNLPVFIHLYVSKDANEFVELARENPKTNYIVAHLMGLENVIKKGSDLTNIYFDTSTYYITSTKRILKAVKYFGADHVFMGSDTPMGYDNLKNIILKINKLPLPQDQINLIKGDGLAKLLSIKK
ncbi:MAG: hypothetical protein FK734_01300 [Asgard group archaeon]|nr:hypothetical protein [Asgard group archaeon]